MTKETEVLKLALDLATMHYTDDGYADLRSKVRVATKEALAQAVPDALHFAQWAAAKKDLSDYICVGSLTLAGIEDGEYGQSEINSFENTIEALQERLVTGSEHKKVPLVAYIGALNSTPPAPLPVQEQTGFKLCNTDLVTQTGIDNNLESLEQLSAHVIKDKP